jgi:hypothetical protein
VSKGGLGYFLEAFSDTSSDSVITNPHLRLELSGDATVRTRGALLLPNATAQATALAALDVDLSAVSDSSWSALSGRGPDGTGRYAVARFGGVGSATVTLTGRLGAPIPDRPNDVSVLGNTGSTSFSLASLASTGFKGYFWVSSTSAETVRPISETLLKIANGSASTDSTVRYVDASGRLLVAARTLAPNQVGFAHAIDDGVAVVVQSATTVTSGHEAWRVYDGNTSASSYWSSTPQDFSSSPQELRLDFGKAVDIGKVTMLPLANAGPKAYLVQTSTTGLNGSFVTVPGGGVTGASATAATTTTFTAPVSARYLQIRISESWDTGTPQSVAVRELSIGSPSLDIDTVAPGVAPSGTAELRLARGGFNQATVRVRNAGANPVTITLSATAPAPMTAVISSANPVIVPAGGYVDSRVDVRGAGVTPTSGSSLLTVSATGASDETITLVHTDNLALSDAGGPFPAARASSEDPAFIYTPSLAVDGATAGTNNFWVSGPAVLAVDPQCITLDFGGSVGIGRVVMIPRTNYGPKDYAVQTSSTDTTCAIESGWTTQDLRTGVTNGSVITSTFAVTNARYLRLRVTATHAAGNPPPPNQTQIRELQVYPN